MFGAFGSVHRSRCGAALSGHGRDSPPKRVRAPYFPCILVTIVLLSIVSADASLSNSSGETALHLCVHSHHPELLKLMLRGCYSRVDAANRRGQTALELARQLQCKTCLHLVRIGFFLILLSTKYVAQRYYSGCGKSGYESVMKLVDSRFMDLSTAEGVTGLKFVVCAQSINKIISHFAFSRCK